MQCCVPFCRNSPDYAPTSEGKDGKITFHSFPSEPYLRAAWLRALGKQNTQVPESAVICSQHFLSDDIYETDSGVRLIMPMAIPSAVQFCMICLNTESKLFLMSKHKLEGAYEQLTGYPLCVQRNLKQTVCAICAQRLKNFKRFKDKTLKARSLMMDLLKKYEVITLQHIETLNNAKYELKCNFVSTTQGPDYCDLHIIGHSGEDPPVKLLETVVIKKEKCYNSTLVDEVDEDTNILDGDVNRAGNVKDEIVTSHENDAYNAQYQLKYESVTFGCTFCSEEFTQEHHYYEHMSMHLQHGDGEGDTSSREPPTASSFGSESSTHKFAVQKLEDDFYSPDLTQGSAAPLHATFAMFKNNENVTPPTEEMDTIKKIGLAYKFNDGELDNKPSDGIFEANVDIDRSTGCGDKAYEVFEGFKNSPKSVSSCGSLKIDEASNDSVCGTANEIVSLATENTSSPKSLQIVTEALIGESNAELNDSLSHGLPSATGAELFICDVCQKSFKQKLSLYKHIKNHSKAKQFTCTFCPYKSKFEHHILTHVRTHTGEKPYTCNLCEFTCGQNSTLVRHMRTHTGERPFSCNLCEFSCKQNFSLVRHMRTHTGEKPYACTMCKYKFAQHYGLVTHMRTHTGERPYSCNLCEYSCIRNSALLRHMRTHTGEKPFPCNLCQYRSARRCDLMKHMRSQHMEKAL